MLTARECGKQCRIAFGELFKTKYGSYRLRNRQILFKNATIFALYSDFHSQTSGWFYDVPQSEWEDWKNHFLVILMKESNEVYYVLLNSEEAVTLLSKCGKDWKGMKKINVRRPTSGGKNYFVEWPDFSLASRLRALHVPWAQY